MTYTVSFVDLQEQHAAVVRGRAAASELPEFLGSAFAETAAAAGQQGLAVTGAPFGRYRPDGGGGFEVEAGFPVSGPVTPAGRVEPATLPGGRAAYTLHIGDYAAVAAAYEATEEHLTVNGYETAGAPWECYLDEPDVAAPRTEVFWPCRAVTGPA